MKIKTRGKITYANHENSVIGITVFHHEDPCDAPLPHIYATVANEYMNENLIGMEVYVVMATEWHGDYCQICGKTLDGYEPPNSVLGSTHLTPTTPQQHNHQVD